MLKKTEIYQFPKTIKTYTLFGFPVLKKEKSPLKRKYNFLGLKFCQTRKHPLPLPANTYVPEKKTPLTFPKGAKQLSYTSPAPLSNTHKRIAVFASFSADGTIHDYVLYYLKELKKITDEIIFIADNPLFPEELEKLKPLTRHVTASRHKEYDFGSYKRGYRYAKKHSLLERTDELILCTDSCYGPVKSFKEMFTEMSAEKCDFWGANSNTDFCYHLQSYFLVFRKPIITSGSLDCFLNKVKKEKNFWDIVYNYEFKLTAYLSKRGFTASSYLPAVINTLESRCIKAGHRNKTVYPLSLIKQHHFPLIKLKCFNNGFTHALQESPLETLDYIKKNAPELHKVILADLKAKNLLKNLTANHFATLLSKADVVSFDVFDTLLIRPYVKPTDMFLNMEKYYQKEGFAQERINAEARARANNPHKKDITFNDIYSEILPKYQDMKEKEIYFETEILQAHPENKKRYEQAVAAKKKIIAASDMYLPAEVIAKLLRKNGYTKIDKVYVSGEYNQTKASGGLFKQILKDCKIKPAKLLHIGDNEISDVVNPKKMGITALHTPKYIDRFFLHDGNKKYQNFYTTQNTLEASIITSLIAIRQLTPPKDSSYWQEIGYNIAGPLALGYTQMLIEETAQNKLDTLLFVSRDGYILQKIYNLLCPSPVDNHYVYAPRVLTLKCCGNQSSNPNYQEKYLKLLHKNINGFPLAKTTAEQQKSLEKYAKEIRAYHQKNLKSYRQYLQTLNISGKNIASVDMTTGAYSSEHLLSSLFKERYKLGFFSAVFNAHPTMRYIAYKKDLINPKKEEGIMMLTELLITAPERPLKDFVAGKPIFKTPAAEDTRRIKIMREAERGILEFVADYTLRHGNLTPNIPMSVNMALMRSYTHHLTPIDTAELKNVTHTADILNQERENLYDALTKNAA